MFGGQRQDTEHQVAEHFVVTAHTHEVGAVAVLERAVDACLPRMGKISEMTCGCSKLRKAEKSWRFSRHRHTVVGMITAAASLWNLNSSPLGTKSPCSGVGLTGCSSHSGRRTFVTRAARLVYKAGGSLRDVQILAGHRSIQTTQRYIDGDTDAQRRLVALI